MEIFCVGGAVRDELLGLPVQDRDWVVVGATPDEMIAQGYRAVGKDFPVFLHPRTQEEYALARTERKTAPGYTGFAFYAAPDVTLEQDLARRDLTINAIAKRDDGTLVDPYGGQRDLHARVLRHVSPAFVEDPVRILRLARFAARFTDFSVATETVDLMTRMVRDGEADHLVPERVWQELSRGLMEAQPSRMFEVLRQCGALAVLLPEVDALWGVPQRADYHPEVDTGVHVMMVIDMAARLGASLPTRFAALAHDLGKGTTPADMLPRHVGHEAASVRLLKPLCERLRVPAECRDVALLVARYHGDMHCIEHLRPTTIVTLLERCDALRRPERFEQILLACEADYRGRGGDYAQRRYEAGARWRAFASAMRNIDAAGIAKRCEDSSDIAAAIHDARVAAVKSVIERQEAAPDSPRSPP